MGAGRVVAVVAVVALVGAGCFPDPPKRVDGDVSDASSGLDTSTPGDTEPQRDTEGGEDTLVADTASDAAEDTGAADTALDTTPDTEVADTFVADTVVADTVAPECTSPADCQHLAGTCVRVQCLGGSCAAQPDTGNPCDDGHACTKGDTCQGFSCVGTAYACDDGVACTDDVCTGDGGCSYPAKAGFCHIGAACVTAGQVKADDPCRVCVGGEAWSGNDGASCEDGDPVCTLDDTCVGTVCEPGGPPDDTAGDWAMNVVESTEPQQAGVMVVHPFGLKSWLFFAQAAYGGVVPTGSGPVVLSDSSLIGLVRPPSHADRVDAVWTGFQTANLEASAALGGWIVAAVRLKGPGSATLLGEPQSLSSEPDDTTYLAGWSVLNGLAFHVPVEFDVESLAITNDAGFVAAATTGSSVHFDALGYHHTGEPGEYNTLAVKFTPTATPSWIVRVSSRDYIPRLAPSCTSPSGSAVVVLAFKGAATAYGPDVQTSVDVGGSGDTVSLAVMRLSADGAIESIGIPFTYAVAPQARFELPEVACLSDGVVLGFRNRMGQSGRPDILEMGRSSVARVSWDGAILWQLTTSAQSIALASADNAIYLFGTTILGSTTPPAVDLEAADGTLLAQGGAGADSVLISLNLDGTLSWFAGYPSQTDTGVMSIATRGYQIALGGFFLGNSGWADPTAHLALTGNGVVNAFGALLNSAGGLSCDRTALP